MPNEDEITTSEIEKAHLAIFSTLSGVTETWRREYDQWGAIALWERLKDGAYAEKTVGTPLGGRISTFNYEKVKNEIEKNHGQFLFPDHPLWPCSINDSRPTPIGLIARGDFGLLKQLKSSISIVGTRNPTRYGERIASEFSSTLADKGWISVSGGALGIDAAVHRGALLAEGETIAVLASPINNPYPPIHFKLFEHISQSGLLITETPFGHPTVAARFLHRNRLIAALTRATVVIEAPYRSGAIRTAHNANEYLRPVFATPGPITSPASEGVHQLIIERQAELVVSVSDLISLLS
jgi:DNA processing protein